MPRDQSECQVVAWPILRAEQASWAGRSRPSRDCSKGSISSCLWAGLKVLTGQWPVLVVQGLGQVLNSEIMLVT